MGRRRGLYLLFAVIAYVLLFALRLRAGLNYGELHLGFPATVQTQGVEVFAKHQNGQLIPLVRREEDAQLFSQLVCPGPCTRLVISVPDSANFAPAELEVRFGEHWGTPSISLPFSAEKSDLVLRGVAQSTTWELIPRNGSSNHTWGLRSACNWQGDIWLFVVPFLQVLSGLAVAVFFGKVWQRLLSVGAEDVSSPPHPGVRLESLPIAGWFFSLVRWFLLLLIIGQVWALLPGFVFCSLGHSVSRPGRCLFCARKPDLSLRS